MTKFYVDSQGNYLGGYSVSDVEIDREGLADWDGAKPPEDAIEVPFAPNHANQKWDGVKFLDLAEQVI